MQEQALFAICGAAMGLLVYTVRKYTSPEEGSQSSSVAPPPPIDNQADTTLPYVNQIFSQEEAKRLKAESDLYSKSIKLSEKSKNERVSNKNNQKSEKH